MNMWGLWSLVIATGDIMMLQDECVSTIGKKDDISVITH